MIPCLNDSSGVTDIIPHKSFFTNISGFTFPFSLCSVLYSFPASLIFFCKEAKIESFTVNLLPHTAEKRKKGFFRSSAFFLIHPEKTSRLYFVVQREGATA